MHLKGRVLIIAGSDSGGGAGIQADIKAVTALGGYAMTAITALTAQNTKGVYAIEPVPADFVRRQIEVVLDDIGADCVKIGMVYSAEIINALADVLEAKAAGIPIVLDPVMVAKGGARLIDDDALRHMKIRLMPMTTLLTPNIPEAVLLAGMNIANLADQTHSAQMLMTLGPRGALIKGGHANRPEIIDVLATEQGVERFEGPRLDTQQTHGTGCTLSSAIACRMAQGLSVREAVVEARAYVFEAIRQAPGFGHGHGPVNHMAPFP